MAAKTVVVLGGGWGGLATAHHLRELLPAEHRVVVVERNDTFSLCVSYLWLMTGERARSSDVRRRMSDLSRPGIEWVHDEVERIDPDTRTVHLRSGPLAADALVIALGTQRDLGMVPGLAESALNLYSADDLATIRDRVTGIDGGRIVILIARAPFSCPAAPYEAAMLVEDMLRRTGARARTEIAVYTPEKQPMPVAGPAVGEALAGMLAERTIEYFPEHAVTRVDGAGRTIHFDGEAASYDLLIAIPPHRAPGVVAGAGLTDATGYVPVHPQTLEILADHETLETRFPGVYAIGDVTAVRLLNAMLLPKAGVFVEAEARIVAENIAAQLEGNRPLARFDGRGFCYIEVGDGLAAYGSGNFYAYPGPTVALDAPSEEYRRAKLELEGVLTSWFR